MPTDPYLKDETAESRFKSEVTGELAKAGFNEASEIASDFVDVIKLVAKQEIERAETGHIKNTLDPKP